MATEEKQNGTAEAGSQAASQQGFVYLPLIAGWLFPARGIFCCASGSRGAAFGVDSGNVRDGLAMQGKLYATRTTFWIFWAGRGPGETGCCTSSVGFWVWAQSRCR